MVYINLVSLIPSFEKGKKSSNYWKKIQVNCNENEEIIKT